MTPDKRNLTQAGKPVAAHSRYRILDFQIFIRTSEGQKRHEPTKQWIKFKLNLITK